jgi:biopolymer transport protein ExbD
MNFQREQRKEEPHIDLVPMIDVLLVILIFLAITTTYSKFSELEITLPQAVATAEDLKSDTTKMIEILINAAGGYVINRNPIKFTSMESLREALQLAAQNREDPIIVISADAKATHQSVITIMEAARTAGYNQITFTTEVTNTSQ